MLAQLSSLPPGLGDRPYRSARPSWRANSIWPSACTAAGTASGSGIPTPVCARDPPTGAGAGGAAALWTWRPPGRPRGLLEGAGTQTRFSAYGSATIGVLRPSLGMSMPRWRSGRLDSSGPAHRLPGMPLTDRTSGHLLRGCASR